MWRITDNLERCYRVRFYFCLFLCGVLCGVLCKPDISNARVGGTGVENS